MTKKLTQADVKNLYHDLRVQKSESDIEAAWKAIFKRYFVDNASKDSNASLNSPAKVDGFITEDSLFPLRLLLEFKVDTDLQKVYDRARITIQCIYYMKKFRDEGIELPNVIVGADTNQAFALYAPNFYKYLENQTFDWSIAPSSAYKKNPQLMNQLIADSNLSVFVYDLDVSRHNINQQREIIQNLFNEVRSLADYTDKQGVFKVDVTESNLAALFDQFSRITFKSSVKKTKISPVDEVNIFQQLLLGRSDDEYYQLPSNPNKLHLPGDKKIDIIGTDMNAFFKHFNRNFSVEEQDTLISISDRLIEDITRRRKGDFWTPTIWANKAIKLIDEKLNNKWQTKQGGLIKDWKKDCAVWDCAAGAKNLTRDFSFSHLFSSTLHPGELELAKSYNAYPDTNHAFQYDFLNDDVDQLNHLKQLDLQSLSTHELTQLKSKLKMPDELFDLLLQDKPLVFYINPPFGTANERSFTSGKAKDKRKMSNTLIKEQMRVAKIGKASQQMYAQFFYRIAEIIDTFKLSNVMLAAFSPYQFRTGGDYFGKFYDRFLQTLHPIDGFLFNAGEFSDVSDGWAITFSIYSNETTFPHSEILDVCEVNSIGEIINVRKKELRTVSNAHSLSSWIKAGQNKKSLGPKLQYGQYTPLTSAIKASDKQESAAYYQNSIGYMYFIGNDIEHSDTAVSIFSSVFKSGHGINITKDNIMKSVIGFAIRRSTDFSWFNGKDQFYIDDNIAEQLLNDPVFILDCLIMSLTQYRSSYQSSLGKQSVPDEFPEVRNEWFFIPNDVMSSLYGKSKIMPEVAALYSNEYNRSRMLPDSVVSKLLATLGINFKVQVSDNSAQLTIQYDSTSPVSNQSKAMLEVLVSLFNLTWPIRPLAIASHPEWSLERFDAGFNQMYRVITNLGDNKAWIESYFSAYSELRNSILTKAKKLKIVAD